MHQLTTFSHDHINKYKIVEIHVCSQLKGSISSIFHCSKIILKVSGL